MTFNVRLNDACRALASSAATLPQKEAILYAPEEGNATAESIDAIYREAQALARKTAEVIELLTRLADGNGENVPGLFHDAVSDAFGSCSAAEVTYTDSNAEHRLTRSQLGVGGV